MVFSDADPTFSISSILSRYDSSASAAANTSTSSILRYDSSASSAAANTSTASRPVPSRANSERKPNPVVRPNGAPASKTFTPTTTAPTLSRPSFPGASKPPATTGASISRIGTTSAVISSKTDAGAIVKKRKVEENSMEKQRAALLAKAKKPSITTGISKPALSKISTAGTRPGTTSAGNTPTEAPKKVGYKELLARAAQAQAEKKSAPGTITHKARPQIKEQKAWQKKLEEQKAGKVGGASGAERSSKSPGVVSGGEKGNAAGKKSAEPAKAVAGKKGVGGATVGGVDGRRPSLGNVGAATKGRVPEKVGRNGSAVDTGTKRKREGPPGAGNVGGSGKISNGYSLPRKNSSRRRDTYEEDEDDDFVVDDDDDPPARGRPYGGSAGGKKYTYYESDCDSGSDMEAAGIDVLEEEERSRRAAVLEDQLQERLEKEMAAKKAAMKKKLMVKKK